jgi:hypothetical protein
MYLHSMLLIVVALFHAHRVSMNVGCGLWHPEAEPLALLRADIDENASRWKEILRESALRREFLDGASDDDAAVVKAFAHRNRESALKTKPKVCINHLFVNSHTPEAKRRHPGMQHLVLLNSVR